MPTRASTWKMSKLRAVKFGPDPSDPIYFEIPPFQRSLVWSTSKQQGLIDSLVSGYPIGAILLSDRGVRDYTDGEGRSHTAPVYFIVDGLQRSDTIAEHLEWPFLRVTAGVLPESELSELKSQLEKILGLATEIDIEVMADVIVDWLQRIRTVDKREFDWTALLNCLGEGLSLGETTKKQDQELKSSAIALVVAIEKKVDIGNSEIPVLIYTGPTRDLPDIFERINSNPTILSKYEVFAASWMDRKVELNDDEIRAAIDSRYSLLENQGYVVDRDPTAQEVSLFEYLFGLSRVITTKFPRLFRTPDETSKPASSAFPLAALLLGLRLDRMDEIPGSLPLDNKGRCEVAALTNAIIEATKFVDEALAPFLTLKLTKESTSVAHGELQIISMIAAVGNHRFDNQDSFMKRSGWVVAEKKFKNSLPQHYLLDILRQTWRGPLYTFAWERTWESSKGSPNGIVPSKYYLEVIPRKSWDDELSIWFSNQKAQLADKRPSVSSSDKTLLKFLYSHTVSVADQERYQFDVEHLFPVDRILGLTIKKHIKGWPIGAIANLCLLEKGANRRKRTETISEFFARPAKTAPSPTEKRSIERLLFCSSSEVAIPKRGGGDAMTESEYMDFLDKRWSTLKIELYRVLNVT